MKPPVLFLSFLLSLTCCSCSPSGDKVDPGDPGQPGDDGSGNTQPGNKTGMKLKVTIGAEIFTATLEDNAASSAFMALLPLTIDMEDVNRNEKYARLGRSLPNSASGPGTIRTGDLMLWGSDGLVLFYKTFSTSYSYTRLGALDDAAKLESAVGTGSVEVIFELESE